MIGRLRRGLPLKKRPYLFALAEVIEHFTCAAITIASSSVKVIVGITADHQDLVTLIQALFHIGLVHPLNEMDSMPFARVLDFPLCLCHLRMMLIGWTANSETVVQRSKGHTGKTSNVEDWVDVLDGFLIFNVDD